MLPCACWTRELNCSYEVLAASLLNSALDVGLADAAEDAVQDGGERPFAVEDVAAHWDFGYLLRCHVDAPLPEERIAAKATPMVEARDACRE